MGATDWLSVATQCQDDFESASAAQFELMVPPKQMAVFLRNYKAGCLADFEHAMARVLESGQIGVSGEQLRIRYAA